MSQPTKSISTGHIVLVCLAIAALVSVLQLRMGSSTVEVPGTTIAFELPSGWIALDESQRGLQAEGLEEIPMLSYYKPSFRDRSISGSTLVVVPLDAQSMDITVDEMLEEQLTQLEAFPDSQFFVDACPRIDLPGYRSLHVRLIVADGLVEQYHYLLIENGTYVQITLSWTTADQLEDIREILSSLRQGPNL